MKKTIISAFCTIFLLSCNALPKTTEATKKQPDNRAPANVNTPAFNSAFLTAVNSKSGFRQVKISSKIQVDMGSYTPPTDATIYIENGQKIWMNLSVAFMNIARGMATPNGIQGYEKITKSYIDSDFSYLNRMLNVNFINYNSFQNLLVGKTTIPVNSSDFTLSNSATGYTLYSKNPQKIEVNGKSSAYNITLDYSPRYDLTRLVMQDSTSPDKVEINYSNWIELENERFPQNVKIVLKGAKTGQILIENTKFDFSKMDAPFSVPSNYTKKEIK